MQKEIQALRGKDLFEKTAHDLCLVPNVKIPHKFKVEQEMRLGISMEIGS